MCGHVNVAKWAAQVNLAITQWTSQRARGRASDNAAAVHGATKPTEERDPRLIHI